MSIRTALTWTVLGISLLGTASLAVLGAQRIRREVVLVAQNAVAQDLRAIEAEYGRRLDAFADDVVTELENLGPSLDELAMALPPLADRLNLSVLSAVHADGRRIAGPAPKDAKALDLRKDPVLRKALAGRPAWGTVRLDPDRLRSEGGEALTGSVALIQGDQTEEAALAWWVGVPLRDDKGRVQALVYGGRVLNHDLDLVDDLRALTLGDERYEGKPRGTVTLFLGPIRAATNVVDTEGKRAIGTRVSDSVARRVLEDGARWNDRAFVVDCWYLSGYAPIRDPDQSVVGMLYVGLLEQPFADTQRTQLLEFLALIGLIGLIAVGATIWLIRRITRPLVTLGHAAEAFARDKWDHDLKLPRTYTELRDLAAAIERMRAAIVERDGRIRRRTEELADANEALERVNRNYMATLGFVTHELKAPLAAIQMQSNLLADQFQAQIPEAARKFLVRIQRNSEELQGMVKNYLDLSRAERGELEAAPVETDIRRDVIDPSVTQSEPLLESRGMRLELKAADVILAHADPELLRIALTNLLSNAAKYGAPEGLVRVEASRSNADIVLSVENEGPGFTAEEGEQLFARFSRLRNKNTPVNRGSGLGLYLVRKIAEQHGGTAEARSDPGAWARFTLRLPVGA